MATEVCDTCTLRIGTASFTGGSRGGVGEGYTPPLWDEGCWKIDLTAPKRLSPEGSGLADDGKRPHALDVVSVLLLGEKI